MLKTSTLNEQVHYSKEFWRQFGIDLVSGDYSSIQTRHLDSITLKVIKEQLEADPDYDSLVAISQHIRASFLDQQEKDERYREYLGLLYWLAAVSSFFFNKNKQYVKPLNKLNPPKTSLLTLPFSYHDLGYKELILLEKEDMDALIKTWGRPRNHKTLREIHPNFWQAYSGESVEPQNSRFEHSNLKPQIQQRFRNKRPYSSSKWESLVFTLICVTLLGLLFIF
ncbi:MAG: hypothetical protein MJE63_25080 [Proteobacteria bacterium]|nr:hypothetical protein [Pseudomonadota bacterium]